MIELGAEKRRCDTCVAEGGVDCASDVIPTYPVPARGLIPGKRGEIGYDHDERQTFGHGYRVGWHGGDGTVNPFRWSKTSMGRGAAPAFAYAEWKDIAWQAGNGIGARDRRMLQSSIRHMYKFLTPPISPAGDDRATKDSEVCSVRHPVRVVADVPHVAYGGAARAFYVAARRARGLLPTLRHEAGANNKHYEADGPRSRTVTDRSPQRGTAGSGQRVPKPKRRSAATRRLRDVGRLCGSKKARAIRRRSRSRKAK